MKIKQLDLPRDPKVTKLLENQNDELVRQYEELAKLRQNLDCRETVLEIVSIACEKLLFCTDYSKDLPDILAQLAQAVGVDVVALVENTLNNEPKELASWTCPAEDATPDVTLILKEIRTLAQNHLEIPEILFPFSSHDNPTPEARHLLNAFIHRDNFKALAVIPIPSSLELSWRALVFSNRDKKRLWTTYDIRTLRIAASLIGAALQKYDAIKMADKAWVQLIKKNYEQLTLTLGRLNAITSIAKDALILLDQKGLISFWNTGAEDIFGYTQEEITGKDCSIFFTNPRLYAVFINRFGYFLDLLQKSEDRLPGNTREFFLTKKNGQEIRVEISFSGQYFQKKIFIVCIGRDVTSRYQAELEKKEKDQKIKELSAKLETVLEAIPDAMYEVHRSGTIIWANKGCSSLFGLDNTLLVGRKCSDFLLAGQKEEPFAQETFRTGISIQKEVSYREGEIWNLRTFPVANANTGSIDHIVICGQDISEQRRMESLAQRNDHLASLGTLTAGVAHEINNPNNFILLNAAVLLDMCLETMPILEKYAEGKKDYRICGFSFEEYKELSPKLLAGVSEGSERIKFIVDHLRDFSRTNKSTSYTRFSVNDVIKKALLLIGSQLKKFTQNFNVNISAHLPQMMGDPNQIEQVVINLLINAGQALTDTAKGFTLSTFYDKMSGCISIKIEDEGSGIREEHLTKIFDPFFSTKLENGGTGLGLSVSHSIIKEHGGELTFVSKAGRGTIVTICLPALVK